MCVTMIFVRPADLHVLPGFFFASALYAAVPTSSFVAAPYVSVFGGVFFGFFFFFFFFFFGFFHDADVVSLSSPLSSDEELAPSTPSDLRAFLRNFSIAFLRRFTHAARRSASVAASAPLAA